MRRESFYVNLELYILDYLESLEITDAVKLDKISSTCHEVVEKAFFGYTMDHDIEDYSPQF